MKQNPEGLAVPLETPEKPLILLVDDTPANLHVLVSALRADYRLKTAANGRSALELLARDDKPDLILLDMMMPGMSGIEVFQQLLAKPETQNIPVIFVTADDSEASHLASLGMGAEDYLGKPVDIPVLLAKVRNLLFRQRVLRQLARSERRFASLAAAAPVGIFSLDRDGNCIFVNPLWTEISGLDQTAAAGKAWLDALHPLDKDRVLADLVALRDAGVKFRREFRFLSHTSVTWVLGQIVLLTDEQGVADGMMGTITDIADRKRAEDAAVNRENELKTLVSSMVDMLLVIDTSGNVREIHQPDHRLFPAGCAWRAGQSFAEILHPQVAEAINASLVDVMSSGEAYRGEVHIETPEGGLWYILTLSLLADSQRYPTGFLAVIRDVTASRSAEEEIRKMAYQDVLTHLPNRRFFTDQLIRALSASRREMRYGALLFLDLDRFKQLNDSLGHEAGDLLLVEVARRLRRYVRDNDTVARLGGDEFVVLLEGLGSEQAEAHAQAEVVCRKLAGELAGIYQLGSHHYRSGASIGVVLFDGIGDTPDSLLKRADQAMYLAKVAGGGYRFEPPGRG